MLSPKDLEALHAVIEKLEDQKKKDQKQIPIAKEDEKSAWNQLAIRSSDKNS